jgi:hypothetical protein
LRRGVIAREERYLERKFGAEYVAYRSRGPAMALSVAGGSPDLVLYGFSFSQR